MPYRTKAYSSPSLLRWCPTPRITASMAEVTGIDHVYIGVTSLAVSEPFYDRVWRDALGLPKFEFLAQSFSRAACRETVSAR